MLKNYLVCENLASLLENYHTLQSLSRKMPQILNIREFSKGPSPIGSALRRSRRKSTCSVHGICGGTWLCRWMWKGEGWMTAQWPKSLAQAGNKTAASTTGSLSQYNDLSQELSSPGWLPLAEKHILHSLGTTCFTQRSSCPTCHHPQFSCHIITY